MRTEGAAGICELKKAAQVLEQRGGRTTQGETETRGGGGGWVISKETNERDKGYTTKISENPRHREDREGKREEGRREKRGRGGREGS